MALVWIIFAAMSDAPFTEADVSYLLKAKKFIHSKVRDNTANEAVPFIEVVYRICRVDRPKEDILLRLTARRTKALSRRLAGSRPSAALLWHNHRVRGIDRKIVHDVIRNGIVVDRVRGWHEHRWSKADGDKSVIGINEEMKNIQEDFQSILRFCMQRWRIEVPKDDDRQQLLNV